MDEITHSQVAYRLGKVIKELEKHELKLILDGHLSFVIANIQDKDEYTTHFIYKTLHTIQEVEFYIQGLEDGKKLSLPKKERK